MVLKEFDKHIRSESHGIKTPRTIYASTVVANKERKSKIGRGSIFLHMLGNPKLANFTTAIGGDKPDERSFEQAIAG